MSVSILFLLSLNTKDSILYIFFSPCFFFHLLIQSGNHIVPLSSTPPWFFYVYLLLHCMSILWNFSFSETNVGLGQNKRGKQKTNPGGDWNILIVVTFLDQMTSLPKPAYS